MSRHGVLLREGYHDRAFLAGLLATRAWHDARGTSGKAYDPLGESVQGGRYAYRRGQSFVVIVPCGGATGIAPAAKQQFQDAFVETRPGRIDHVIACFDGDTGASGRRQSVSDRWQEIFGSPPPSPAPWTDHGVRVDVSFLGATATGFAKSLDGLVGEAFSRSYGERFAAVQSWLANRPDSPPPAKETLWSIMAGWFAEQGCEAFLQHGLWTNPAVKARLLAGVDSCGLKPVLDALEA